jgi:3-deoxy-D-manno-octulosonate 8-phosphate phosphatase (KDO 8-P phosphatase)
MQFASPDALERARRVKLMLFDVDGVLTDGNLWYSPAGEEIKSFHSFDGLGVKLLAQSGVEIALLSGRSSPAVAARAAELGVEHVLQGVEDKRERYEAFIRDLGFQERDTGFMGDDLVDVPVLLRCGFACTVHEAPEEVRKRVHYVAASPAGGGAAREVCEYIMRAQGTLARVLRPYLG